MSAESDGSVNTADFSTGGQAEIATLIVISIHKIMLAVPAELVTSVSAVQEPTPLPGAPPHIPGLVANGERALPLVDLEILLDLRGRDDGIVDPLFRRVLFVRAGDLEAGLVCHRSRGLISIDRGELGEPMVLQGERLRPFLAAELNATDNVIGVLAIEALLAAAAIK